VLSCLNEDFNKYIIAFLTAENDKNVIIHHRYQAIITLLNIQRIHEDLVDLCYGSITEKKIIVEEKFP
jgi:hypothetical protein